MTGFHFPVEAGNVMTFSRAIGETSQTSGDLAPATFVASSSQYDPDYPMRPKPGQPWIGANPALVDNNTGVLAAERHFEFSRAVRVGDVFNVEIRPGKQWDKDGRQGKLYFSEIVTEFHDVQGDLVVKMRTVFVRVEQKADGGIVS